MEVTTEYLQALFPNMNATVTDDEYNISELSSDEESIRSTGHNISCKCAQCVQVIHWIKIQDQVPRHAIKRYRDKKHRQYNIVKRELTEAKRSLRQKEAQILALQTNATSVFTEIGKLLEELGVSLSYPTKTPKKEDTPTTIIPTVLTEAPKGRKPKKEPKTAI